MKALETVDSVNASPQSLIISGGHDWAARRTSSSLGVERDEMTDSTA